MNEEKTYYDTRKYSYEEVKEVSDKLSANAFEDREEIRKLAEDRDMAASIILYRTAQTFNVQQALVLENLIGIPFDTKKDIYDYLTKTVKIDKEFLGQMSFCFLMDSFLENIEKVTTEASEEE